MCIHHIVFNPFSSIGDYFFLFSTFWLFLNSVTINMEAQISLHDSDFTFGLNAQKWDCWIIFNFLRKLHSVFQTLTILHSHQQRLSIQFLYILPPTHLLGLLDNSHLNRRRWYFIMVLIYSIWWLVILSIF